jgi:hypothetical protein
MPKKMIVVESKWVNWDWMKKKKDKHFRWVREACDFLELIDMLQFEHNWNTEIICQFYSTLYFDDTGQKIS